MNCYRRSGWLLAKFTKFRRMTARSRSPLRNEPPPTVKPELHYFWGKRRGMSLAELHFLLFFYSILDNFFGGGASLELSRL